MEYQYFTEKVWDEVHHDIIYGDCYAPVFLEVFTPKNHTENKDEYEIETSEGFRFSVFMNYSTGEQQKEDLVNTMMVIKNYEDVYDDIIRSLSDDDIAVTVLFTDDQKHTNNTNEVKHGAVSVFKSLQRALINSLSKRYKRGNRLKLLKFFVNKGDTKKAELYDRCIKQATANLFSHKLIDDKYDKRYDVYFYYNGENQ